MDDINSILNNYRKTGDKIWFEKLFYLYMPKIYNYFCFKTADKHLSEDLASEVLLKVYKNLNTKKFNVRSFNVWIFTIAKNHLIDHIRKIKDKNKTIPLSDWLEFGNINDKNLMDEYFLINNSVLLKKEFSFEDPDLLEAMKKLTVLQKNVLFLFFVMEFDQETIASILTRKRSTIRGIIYRAINILKNEIKNE